MIDIRGHGDSTLQPTTEQLNDDTNNDNTIVKNPPPPHSIKTAGDDVYDTVMRATAGSGAEVVIGHSLGGKVALRYLERTINISQGDGGGMRVPENVFVLDSIPGAVDRGKATGEKDSVMGVIEAVSSIETPIPSKKDLVRTLVEEKGISQGVAMWMTTNLRKSNGSDKGFDFTFDIPIAKDLFSSFGETDYFPFLKSLSSSAYVPRVPPPCTVHLVLATKNTGWKSFESEVNDLQGEGGGKGNVKVHKIDAGHWVHVDDLEGVVKIVTDPYT